MWWLVGRLVAGARALAVSRGFQIGAGTALITDFVNLDWLRQQSIKLAPGSDQAAIEQAARTAAQLLGLAGDEILWPTHRRGARQGEPIVPLYLTIDLVKGRGWFSSRHYSYKSARRRRFGYRRYGSWNRGGGGGSNVVVTK